VYIKVKRSLPVPTLASFDSADVDATCPVRFATTQPTQALHMLNSAFVNEQARIFADFVREKVGTDTAKQVEFILWRTTQRPPTATEITRGVRLLAELKREDGQTDQNALTYYCLLALNLNEFIFLD
jgi:hypothetical protein